VMSLSHYFAKQDFHTDIGKRSINPSLVETTNSDGESEWRRPATNQSAGIPIDQGNNAS
jgi:hypothetical protein